MIIFIGFIISILCLSLFLRLYVLQTEKKLVDRLPKTIYNNITTIDDAVKYLNESSLKEWNLVGEAQKIVNLKMKYSRRNGWDTPEKAFEIGYGYCCQQAEALNVILKKCGIDSRIVNSTRCKFTKSKKIHEYVSKGGILGHAWVRVKLNNVEKDVCPGDETNYPGKLHFEILGKVSDYKGLISFLGYVFSPVVNAYLDNKDLRKFVNIKYN